MAVLGIDVGPVANQQIGHFVRVFLSCEVQRSPTHIVARHRICPVRKQFSRALKVAIRGGVVELGASRSISLCHSVFSESREREWVRCSSMGGDTGEINVRQSG